MELFARQAMEVDIVITTALIPGKPAPELWTEAMVESMKDGSVVVDLAAEMGGNCKLTEKDKVVVKHGVNLNRIYRSCFTTGCTGQPTLCHQSTPSVNGYDAGKRWAIAD